MRALPVRALNVLRGGVRCGVLAAALFAALAATLAGVPRAAAAPEDDHRRALTAYQRGDVVAAMRALRPAAAAGHAPSQTLLAFILDRADDAQEAARLYAEAARAGDPEGHAGLANLLLAGRGIAKDEKRAFEHFSKAAALGHAPSVEIVATAWVRSRLGANAAAQPEAARAALERAAALGHLESIDALADGHANGRYGLPRDAAEAERWRARAAALRAERARPPAAGPVVRQ